MEIKGSQGRKIIHIDMDCFYAAVECKYRPELKGKPLGIGGPPDSRSVLCTASYEARQCGVRAAMPSSQAVRLCPQLILVPPRFDLYKLESACVREIFERFTKLIEPLSLDEAYLDVTNCTAFGGSATLIAKEIRRLIYEERGLTASAGIASNKFLAKVASDWRKPNGQFVVTPEMSFDFASALKVGKIFGVGKVTEEKMKSLGFHTCADIQKCDLLTLKRHFGSRAQELYDFSRGIDHRSVVTEWERRSLSVEETFEKDLTSLEQIHAVLPSLFAEWSQRWSKEEQERGSPLEPRGAVVKLKFFDFKSTTHEISLRQSPSLECFKKLLETAYQRRQEPVRLVGIGVRLPVGKSEIKKESDQLSLL